MSCVTKSIFNSLSMATNSSCLVSLPSRSSSSAVATATNCNKTSISHSYLALPSKPINFLLSCSHSYSPSSTFLNSFLSLKKKRASRFSCLVSILDIKQEEDGGEDEEGFEAGFEFEGNEQSEGEYDGGDVTEGEVEGEGEVVGEEEYQEPSEDAKLFVGNLPYDVDSETLAQLFEQAGVVEIAEVVI